MFLYDFLIALFLCIFAWGLVFTFNAFLNDSLSILLGIDCEQESENNHVKNLNPVKWIILAGIYFIIIVTMLIVFETKLHDVFGMNYEAIEK